MTATSQMKAIIGEDDFLQSRKFFVEMYFI